MKRLKVKTLNQDEALTDLAEEVKYGHTLLLCYIAGLVCLVIFIFCVTFNVVGLDLSDKSYFIILVFAFLILACFLSMRTLASVIVLLIPSARTVPSFNFFTYGAVINHFTYLAELEGHLRSGDQGVSDKMTVIESEDDDEEN